MLRCELELIVSCTQRGWCDGPFSRWFSSVMFSVALWLAGVGVTPRLPVCHWAAANLCGWAVACEACVFCLYSSCCTFTGFFSFSLFQFTFSLRRVFLERVWPRNHVKVPQEVLKVLSHDLTHQTQVLLLRPAPASVYAGTCTDLDSHCLWGPVPSLAAYLGETTVGRCISCPSGQIFLHSHIIYSIISIL